MSRELGLAGGETKGSCSRDHRYSLGVTLGGGKNGPKRNSLGMGQGQPWDMAGTALGQGRDSPGTQQGHPWDRAGTSLGHLALP